MEESEDKKICVRVQSLGFTYFEKFTVSQYTTIITMKELISKKNNFDITKMRLLFQGISLVNSLSLFDYNISDNDIIYAVPSQREKPQFLPISINVNVQSLDPTIIHYRPETRDFDRQINSMRSKIAEIQSTVASTLQRIAMTIYQDDLKVFKHGCRLVNGKLAEVIQAMKTNSTSLKQYEIIDNNGQFGASFNRIGELQPPTVLTHDLIITNVSSSLGELLGASPGSNLVPHTVFHFPDISPSPGNEMPQMQLPPSEIFSQLLTRMNQGQNEGQYSNQNSNDQNQVEITNISQSTQNAYQNILNMQNIRQDIHRNISRRNNNNNNNNNIDNLMSGIDPSIVQNFQRLGERLGQNINNDLIQNLGQNNNNNSNNNSFDLTFDQNVHDYNQRDINAISSAFTPAEITNEQIAEAHNQLEQLPSERLFPGHNFTLEEIQQMDRDRLMITEIQENENLPPFAPEYYHTRILGSMNM
ncbi:hypothetical protein TRFO_21377 [Tritrichomonas foetus]|uniref:Ubiquitin-like domain-containing protein n=1 Tax=Tritrichomonas foetus TaxID=1144522 RepID=A0A1J4KF54_9EUKA|nr:hypothetical protein TRFO_21377 [Tritrichomonas foetus]|eukprot:OHT09658.1 hypothetical protein TRFO_21377 [Tritrichomonas foetus]